MQAWEPLDAAQEIIPTECQGLLDGRARPLPGTGHVRPFALKHARQQAAILGQLQAHGLLQVRTTPLHGKQWYRCCGANAWRYDQRAL